MHYAHPPTHPHTHPPTTHHTPHTHAHTPTHTQGASKRAEVVNPRANDVSPHSAERREQWIRNRLTWLRAGVYKVRVREGSCVVSCQAQDRRARSSFPPELLNSIFFLI